MTEKDLEIQRLRQRIAELELEQAQETVEINIYDEEEIFPGCTVQVLRNSYTGQISVGWWRNEE